MSRDRALSIGGCAVAGLVAIAAFTLASAGWQTVPLFVLSFLVLLLTIVTTRGPELVRRARFVKLTDFRYGSLYRDRQGRLFVGQRDLSQPPRYIDPDEPTGLLPLLELSPDALPRDVLDDLPVEMLLVHAFQDTRNTGRDSQSSGWHSQTSRRRCDLHLPTSRSADLGRRRRATRVSDCSRQLSSELDALVSFMTTSPKRD